MSKIENITCDDVKDIIRLACPYYEKKARCTIMIRSCW